MSLMGIKTSITTSLVVVTVSTAEIGRSLHYAAVCQTRMLQGALLNIIHKPRFVWDMILFWKERSNDGARREHHTGAGNTATSGLLHQKSLCVWVGEL